MLSKQFLSGVGWLQIVPSYLNSLGLWLTYIVYKKTISIAYINIV